MDADISGVNVRGSNIPHSRAAICLDALETPLLQAASTNKMLAFDNLMQTVRATHYHRLHIVRSHRATDHVALA